MTMKTLTASASPAPLTWEHIMPQWAIILLDRAEGTSWRRQSPVVKRMPKTVEVTFGGRTVKLARRNFA